MKFSKPLTFTVFFFLIYTNSFSQLFRPYNCGPVVKKDMLPMFDTLNQYLNIRPGTVFAEIGASSGYYNGAMAVYLDDVTFYLQDIDESCLNPSNLEKLLKYFSKFRDTPIDKSNSFHIAIGTDTKTNLPENAIDVIYSNATFHALTYPDSIVADLYGKLTLEGTLSIRDEFVNHDSIQYCRDKKCGNPLTKRSDFLEIMNRNGFVLFKQTDQFGYPVYTFKKEGDFNN